MSKTNLKSKEMAKITKTAVTANVGDTFLVITAESAMPNTRYAIKKHVITGHKIMVKEALDSDFNEFRFNNKFEASRNQRNPKVNDPIFDEQAALDLVNELNEGSYKEFLEIQREVEDMGKVLKAVKNLYEGKTTLDYDKLGHGLELNIDTTKSDED